MNITQRIHQAISFASRAHEGQLRKISNTSYISHPFAVMTISSNYTNDEDTLIAALLHDVVEDVNKEGYAASDIRTRFGDRVLDLVLQLSEDKSLPYQERKQEYYDRIKNLDQEALLVKTADVLHNTINLSSDLRTEPELVTQVFDVKAYNNYMRTMYTELKKYSEYDQALVELKQAIEVFEEIIQNEFDKHRLK